MNITLSPQDYATAFRLLAKTSRHQENIARFIQERALTLLPEQLTLLDVGAGPGTVARRLAPLFSSLTLIEPNPDQLSGFELAGAQIFQGPLEHYDSPERYDLVLCSHVLYHVPLADWGGYIDRLLALTRPGGVCLLVLGAARGQSYRMYCDFAPTEIVSERLIQVLKEKRIPHEVSAALNGFSASSFEEMYTLCRFLVYEDCYTHEKLATLSENEARQLDDKLRTHAERCRGSDGVYHLEQDDDLILIPKPQASAHTRK